MGRTDDEHASSGPSEAKTTTLSGNQKRNQEKKRDHSSSGHEKLWKEEPSKTENMGNKSTVKFIYSQNGETEPVHESANGLSQTKKRDARRGDGANKTISKNNKTDPAPHVVVEVDGDETFFSSNDDTTNTATASSVSVIHSIPGSFAIYPSGFVENNMQRRELPQVLQASRQRKPGAAAASSTTEATNNDSLALSSNAISRYRSNIRQYRNRSATDEEDSSSLFEPESYDLGGEPMKSTEGASTDLPRNGSGMLQAEPVQSFRYNENERARIAQEIRSAMLAEEGVVSAEFLPEKDDDDNDGDEDDGEFDSPDDDGKIDAEKVKNSKKMFGRLCHITSVVCLLIIAVAVIVPTMLRNNDSDLAKIPDDVINVTLDGTVKIYVPSTYIDLFQNSLPTDQDYQALSDTVMDFWDQYFTELSSSSKQQQSTNSASSGKRIMQRFEYRQLTAERLVITNAPGNVAIFFTNVQLILNRKKEYRDSTMNRAEFKTLLEASASSLPEFVQNRFNSSSSGVAGAKFASIPRYGIAVKDPDWEPDRPKVMVNYSMSLAIPTISSNDTIITEEEVPEKLIQPTNLFMRKYLIQNNINYVSMEFVRPALFGVSCFPSSDNNINDSVATSLDVVYLECTSMFEFALPHQDQSILTEDQLLELIRGLFSDESDTYFTEYVHGVGSPFSMTNAVLIDTDECLPNS